VSLRAKLKSIRHNTKPTPRSGEVQRADVKTDAQYEAYAAGGEVQRADVKTDARYEAYVTERGSAKS
jgi:hypothetical protein